MKTQRKRGTTLAELLACVVVVSLLVSLTASWLVASASGQQAAEYRLRTQVELGNLAETVRSLPYESVTAERLGQLKMTPTITNKKFVLQIEVESEKGPPAAKRVTLRIESRRTPSKVSKEEVVIWRYANQEEAP